MDDLELPDLPAGYRWRIDPGDHAGEWDVTIEHRVGWRWWREGWRDWWTLEARVFRDGGRVDVVDDVRRTAHRMKRDLDRERAKLEQDEYLRRTLDREPRRRTR